LELHTTWTIKQSNGHINPRRSILAKDLDIMRCEWALHFEHPIIFVGPYGSFPSVAVYEPHPHQKTASLKTKPKPKENNHVQPKANLFMAEIYGLIPFRTRMRKCLVVKLLEINNARYASQSRCVLSLDHQIIFHYFPLCSIKWKLIVWP
jgi:hypothetical protein